MKIVSVRKLICWEKALFLLNYPIELEKKCQRPSQMFSNQHHTLLTPRVPPVVLKSGISGIPNSLQDVMKSLEDCVIDEK